FAKKLSTVSLSAGTAKIDNINHASYSIKLNLYKKNDVINDTILLKQIKTEHLTQLDGFNKLIDSLVILRYQTTDPKRKEGIDKELDIIRYEQKNIHEISR